MPEIYLTPSSISFLSLFILTFIVTVYIVSRSIGRGKRFSLRQDGALLAVFASLTLLSLLFFGDYSYLPSDRLTPAFLQPVAIDIMLLALLQFAYDFPAASGKHKIERLLVSLFSIYCLYQDSGIVIYRFNRLHQEEYVAFLGNQDFIRMGIQFALVIFIFTRTAVRNWKIPASRNFALIMLIPVGLVVLSFFRGNDPIITFWYPILSSTSLLFTTLFFILNYLSSQPERTSFVIKISGAMLTGVLAVFGVIAWLVAQPYADRYVSPIQQLDHRTLHFSPDGKDGYTVSEIPFQWEDNYGRAADWWQHGTDEINFNFPLLGKPYSRVFLSNYCSIGMEFHYWGNFQYRFTSAPMIMPLLVDLDDINLQGGNYYVFQDRNRLVFTCSNLPSQGHADARYTFQTVLFSDGSFTFSYNGLPQLKYYVDDYPDKTAWAIGIKPKASPLGTADFTNLPMQFGPEGAIQDEYRNFRNYMHEFLLPLAVAVVTSSALFLLGAAALLTYGLARPLNSLLAGVQNFDRGSRDAVIPVQSNDEIGYLTESFNKVGAELNSLINGLEQRVAERTVQLRSEMDARLAAQGQVMEQQRAVAALEERERLARELHDGIGQVLGFINVQAQSANDSVRAGQQVSASQLLERMAEVAQEAHDDVRGYILGLKREPSTRPRQDFITQLEQYCEHLAKNFGFHANLILPESVPPALASKAAEMQLLFVIREALSNARAHSGEKESTVTITYDEQFIKAVVEDRGAGFASYDSPERRKSGHFGLGIMRERAEDAGGSLEIASAPGSGTRVTVVLPRQPKAESRPGRRVLLVDDHPLFLEGMSNLMAGRGMKVVGVANDGLEAQSKARELLPDVILMDIEMPVCDGLEATRRIKAEMPDVKIVMLTVSGEERHLFEALQNGASGYLLKSLDAAELTCLLDELLRGEVSLSPSLANKMLEAFTRHKAPSAQPPAISQEPELTERQMDILRMVSQGSTYKETASQLGVAEVTIKYHMGEILTRLHLNSKREAVQYFQEGKLK